MYEQFQKGTRQQVEMMTAYTATARRSSRRWSVQYGQLLGALTEVTRLEQTAGPARSLRRS